MTDVPLWITPIAVLAVLLLFRFVGCTSFGSAAQITLGNPYPVEVMADKPVGYWRFQEKTLDHDPWAPAVVAKNEVGPPDGQFEGAVLPLSAGDPAWLSTAVPAGVKIELGVTDLPAIEPSDPSVTSFRLDGSFIHVPFSAALNPLEFTLEVLVFPEWTLFPPNPEFHCVLESSSNDPSGPGLLQKKRGYALYAGPDDLSNPSSRFTWQFWVGDGTGFHRLVLKNPLAPGDPGLAVVPEPTYLAATLSNTQAFLHIYHPGRNLDFLKYELIRTGYAPANSQELFIGIAGQDRALFPPFPGPVPPNFLYPFHGRIAEVAIYDKVLAEERLMSHGGAF